MSRCHHLSIVLAFLLSFAAAAPAQAQDVRLLAGVAAEGGGFVDRSDGLMGGVGVHFGIHIFGFELFGLSQGFIGSIMGGPNSGSVEGVLWHSGMLGFGVGPFHLAVGPSLDFAWGCRDQNAGARCYNGDALFGLDGRAALVFGSFSVSVDVHPTFYGSSTVTGIVLGLGWEY